MKIEIETYSIYLHGGKMEIFTDKTFLNGLDPVRSFQAAFGESSERILASAAALEGTSRAQGKMIMLRVAIDNATTISREQKFIAAIQFWGFGQVATLDIISSHAEHHCQIAYDYGCRLDCILPDLGTTDEAGKTYMAPFIYSGAQLKVAHNSSITTFGPGTQIDDSFLGYNVLDVANYALSVCGITNSGSLGPGERFVRNLLRFMMSYGHNPSFYERFAGEQLKNGTNLSRLDYESLLFAKVGDRAVEEEGDARLIMIDELRHGFAQNCPGFPRN